MTAFKGKILVAFNSQQKIEWPKLSNTNLAMKNSTGWDRGVEQTLCQAAPRALGLL